MITKLAVASIALTGAIFTQPGLTSFARDSNTLNRAKRMVLHNVAKTHSRHPNAS